MSEGKRGDAGALTSLQSRSEARQALHSFLQLLKHQYNFTPQEVVEEFHGSSDDIPLSIFSTPLSPAEALVKYLKEERGVGFHAIGQLINRDERGVWSSYARTKQKYPSRFAVQPAGYRIPGYLFVNRSLSILEHVIFYLHVTLHLSEKEISTLLNKRQAVVHTTLQRARAKRGQS